MPNRRIRKKKGLGEFAILGFKVAAEKVTRVSSDEEIWLKLDSAGFLCAGRLRTEKLDIAVWKCDGCDSHSFKQTDAADQAWVREVLISLGAEGLHIGPLKNINDDSLYVDHSF